ncbi:hypothetical protein BGZ63DRAFT_220823 [Mariannaea sp. PMI_226]|nr:hypothetical protein BGZ63DRAFT_220823 [Mariannaea sp. PMI_226]
MYVWSIEMCANRCTCLIHALSSDRYLWGKRASGFPAPNSDCVKASPGGRGLSCLRLPSSSFSSQHPASSSLVASQSPCLLETTSYFAQQHLGERLRSACPSISPPRRAVNPHVPRGNSGMAKQLSWEAIFRISVLQSLDRLAKLAKLWDYGYLPTLLRAYLPSHWWGGQPQVYVGTIAKSSQPAP